MYSGESELEEETRVKRKVLTKRRPKPLSRSTSEESLILTYRNQQREGVKSGFPEPNSPPNVEDEDEWSQALSGSISEISLTSASHLQFQQKEEVKSKYEGVKPAEVVEEENGVDDEHGFDSDWSLVSSASDNELPDLFGDPIPNPMKRKDEPKVDPRPRRYPYQNYYDNGTPMKRVASDGRPLIYNRNSCRWFRDDPELPDPPEPFPLMPTLFNEDAIAYRAVPTNQKVIRDVKHPGPKQRPRKKRGRKPQIQKPYGEWDCWELTM